MVVTMRAMGEVQVTGDQIIEMVSVRHCLMSAVRAMAMFGLMPLAAMGRRACRRVLRGDTETMFIDMIAVQIVQMPVMEIVGVATMADGRMPTVRSVLVIVMLMDGVVMHCRTPFVGREGSDVVFRV
jgi:hypothetical protein